MSIDFENKESRLKYLDEKLDNLLSGINSTYGQALLDELVVRLERTIKDFNEEVQKIMGNLKDNSDRKNKIIHDLMEGNQPFINKKSSKNEPDESEDDKNIDNEKKAKILESLNKDKEEGRISDEEFNKAIEILNKIK